MRHAFGCTMAAAISLAASPSKAQSTESARSAYDSAVRAHGRGDYARAARDFARADRLVPNDSALRDAIEEASRAEDAILGLMLVARATRSPANAELQQAAVKAREKFRGRAGRFAPECPDNCNVFVDGQEVDPESERWLAVGEHRVALASPSYPGHRDEHLIEVLPLETTVVRFVPPMTEPPRATRPVSASAASPDGGLSPVWFWAGTGITALLGGATIISGLDVSSRRQEFDALRCPQVGSSSCDEHAATGDGAVTRTNVLLGATAVAALATVITAFIVRWNPRPASVVGRF